MANYHAFLVSFKEQRQVVMLRSLSDSVESFVRDIFGDIIDSHQVFFQVRDDGWKEFIEPEIIAGNCT